MGSDLPWVILQRGSEVLAIHAALLPTNQILLFGGDEFNYNQFQTGAVDNSRLFFFDNTWRHRDLTAETGAPAAAAAPSWFFSPADNTAPSGFFSPADNTLQVLYLGREGHVHELFYFVGERYWLETIGSPTTDLFCCGHAFLADGRLLTVGGTQSWGGGPFHHHHDAFSGEKACWTYEPWHRRWHRVASLNSDPGEPPRPPNPAGGGRWYPGVITLANGDVLAVSGHPDVRDHRGHNNDQPELYSPSADTWKLQPGERFDRDTRDEQPGSFVGARFYPRMHLLPDGNVFFVSPTTSTVPGVPPSNNLACRVYDPISGLTVGGTIPPPEGGDNLYTNGYSYSSVLLPLLPGDNYRPRILVCGRRTARRIDFPAGPPWQPVPKWADTAAREGAAAGKLRLFCNATILPTGDVFVCGGIDGSVRDGSITEIVDDTVGYPDTRAVRHAELYDPGIRWDSGGRYVGPDRWHTIDEAQVARNYHSTALLMPDGRVWTAGSSKNHKQGDGELRIELWKPPYDNDPSRPDLMTAPASIEYGRSFEVRCNHAAHIGAVALIRCGSVTHAFNFDQRYVGLTFQYLAEDRLRIHSPPNGGIAPPGYYLLWVVNQERLPCKLARFVRVGRPVWWRRVDPLPAWLWSLWRRLVGLVAKPRFPL